MGKFVDWLAKQVQNSTGETERRDLVLQLKEFAIAFKQKLSDALRPLNEAIERFNQKISELNAIRKREVHKNIETLFSFLQKYGNCKSRNAYAQERQALPAEFPKQEMDAIENYIGNVDWSQDQVFLETFLRTPVGIRMSTRKQNLSMREQLHEFQLKMDAMLQEIEGKTFVTKIETDICELYMENVRLITDIITTKILPEIELVDAFFQVEIIKNQVLSERPVEDTSFSYPISTLIGTPYETHYQFIKNAFLFYVISCRIFDTPILTRLLDHSVLPEDYQQLQKERELLDDQAKSVTDTMLLPRGESR